MKKAIFVLLVIMIFMLATSCSEACDQESVGEGIPEEITDIPVNEFIDELNPDRNYLIIVNVDNSYDFDGKYAKALKKDLVYMSDYDGVPRPLERATYAAFVQLKRELFKDEDIKIALVSGYRDKTEQEMVNEGYYQDLPKGKVQFSDKTKPGFSEHHTGLLLRFAVLDDDKWSTNKDLVDDSDYSEIWDSLPDYGFIVRYPENRSCSTGHKYDPYEIRFVGSSKVAHEIMAHYLSLEQYME